MIEPDVEKNDFRQPCGGVEWTFQTQPFGIWFKIHRGCQVHYWDITCLFCGAIVEQPDLVRHNCKSSSFSDNELRGEDPLSCARSRIYRRSPAFPPTHGSGGTRSERGMLFFPDVLLPNWMPGLRFVVCFGSSLKSHSPRVLEVCLIESRVPGQLATTPS